MKLRSLDLTTRIAAFAVVTIVASIATFAALLDHEQRRALLTERETAMANGLQLGDLRLRQTIDTLRKDSIFLSRTPPVSGIMRGRTGMQGQDDVPVSTWELRLQQIFSAFALAHPHYYQVRLLGIANGGQEIVRVDLIRGKAVVTPPAELQKKGDRDYFLETTKLRSGDVFLSEINLNREWGQIEVPHKRTIRAATPIFTADGRLFGMIVINMKMDPLLSGIAEGVPPNARTFLANGNGDFLVHPEWSHTFGFDLERRHRWQDEMPDLDISSVAGPNAVIPLQEVHFGSELMYATAGRIHFDPLKPERYLLLVYALPESAIDDQMAQTRQTTIIASFITALLTIGIVLLVLRQAFAPLRSITGSALAVANGSEDVEFPVFQGGVLGTLTTALRYMLDRLKERENDLVELNNGLEERVRERTADLQLAASVFENTSEGILITDARGRIVSVNPAFTEITGYIPEDVIGRRPSILRSDRHEPGFLRRIWHSLNAEGGWKGEVWNRRKNGEAYVQWLTLSLIRDKEGKPTKCLGVFHDITELRRRDEHIRRLAYHDPLTGLPNRMLLHDRLEHGVAACARENRQMGILFLDLDGFKVINDRLGHEAGDRLLSEVALRLSLGVRRADTVARFGGDEFVILMESLDDPTACAVLAEKVMASLNEPMTIAGEELTIGCSIGIAVFPEHGRSPMDLIKHADTAMYAAKAAGRGGFCFFELSMTDPIARRLKFDMEIQRALDQAQLELHYQPIVSLFTGLPSGFEALIRWRHPDRGLIAPVEFLPTATENGLIGRMDEWVIGEACRQASEWHRRGFDRFKIAVNLSPRQMEHDALPSRITEIASDHGIGPEILEVEIAESAISNATEEGAEMLRRLHGIGVNIIVDDVGIGWTDQEEGDRFRRLPIGLLKIDRSIIRGAERREDHARIVREVLMVGRTLHLPVVAEGVETVPTADFLREAECSLAQGYLYSRPLPPREIENWLMLQSKPGQ